VIVVSPDSRNRHGASDAVLVVPLTTAAHKPVVTHLFLPAGETGLQADSAARCEDIMAVRKVILEAPRQQLRQLSSSRLCELAQKVAIAMGCPPRPQVK